MCSEWEDPAVPGAHDVTEGLIVLHIFQLLPGLLNGNSCEIEWQSQQSPHSQGPQNLLSGGKQWMTAINYTKSWDSCSWNSVNFTISKTRENLMLKLSCLHVYLFLCCLIPNSTFFLCCEKLGEKQFSFPHFITVILDSASSSFFQIGAFAWNLNAEDGAEGMCQWLKLAIKDQNYECERNLEKPNQVLYHMHCDRPQEAVVTVAADRFVSKSLTLMWDYFGI